MKNVHPCTFFIDEFEAQPQTSLLRGTSGIHAAFACEVEQLGALRKPPVAAKPNRQNVWCGAV